MARNWMVAAAVMVGMAAGVMPAAAQEAAPVCTHVRGASAEAQALVADGLRRSETIRSLVAALEASDVIVYVDMVYVARGPVAATSLTTANAAVRMLRVRISPILDADRALEILGHELQHAAEIAADARVRDAASLRAHSEAVGWATDASNDHFETKAAVSAERLVRCDLAGRPCADGGR